jgi:hypothetical protein
MTLNIGINAYLGAKVGVKGCFWPSVCKNQQAFEQIIISKEPRDI